MQVCAQHVEYQLLNEHSYVGFLLDSIQNSDPGLQAAMASICTDTGVGGKHTDLEATAAHISCPMTLWPRNVLPVPSNLTLSCLMWKAPLPLLPLMLCQALARWVSTCNGTQKRSTTSSLKPKRRSFMNGRIANLDVTKLPEKMKTEGKGKYYTKKQISSLVTKHVKLELDKETEQKKEQDDDAAYIISLIRMLLPLHLLL